MATNMVNPNEAYGNDNDKLLSAANAFTGNVAPTNSDKLLNAANDNMSRSPLGQNTIESISYPEYNSLVATVQPQQQSDFEKLFNAQQKGTIKALSAFANGFTDLLYGLPYGIYKSVEQGRLDLNPQTMGISMLSNATKDVAAEMSKNPNITAQKIYEIADRNSTFGIRHYMGENPFRKWTSEMEELAEKVFPNIYSQKELSRPFWENAFSSEGWANFWGDVVIKNGGYTVGAAAQMIVTGGLLRAASGMNSLKGLRNINQLSADIVSNIKAGNAKQIEKLFATNAIKLEQGIEPILELAKANRSKNLTNMLFASFTGSSNEANMEAYNAGKLFYDNQIEAIRKEGREPTRQELIDIQRGKEGITNAVYGTNLAILMPTNIFQFGRAIARPFERTSKFVSKLITPTGNKLLKTTGVEAIRGVSQVGKKGVLGTTQDVIKVLSKPIAEGTEESLQRVISTAAKEYYNQYLDKDGNVDLKTTISAIGKGFIDAFGTESGWEEFSVGFIMGALGIPMGSTKVGNKTIPVVGGVFEDIVNIQKDRAEVKQLNKYFKENPDVLKKMMQNYNTAVSTYKNERTYQEAMQNADVFEMDNAAANDVIQMFQSAINNGGFEALIHKLENVKIMDTNTLVQELGEVIHPDFQVNDADKQRYINNLIRKGYEIKEISDAVKDTMPNIPTELKDMVVFAASTVHDAAARRSVLAEQIEDTTDGVLSVPILEGTDFTNKEQVDFFAETLNNAATFIKGKKYQEQTLTKQLEEYVKLQQRLSSFSALYDSLINGKVTPTALYDVMTAEMAEQKAKQKAEVTAKRKDEGISLATEAISKKLDDNTLSKIAKDYPFVEVTDAINNELKVRELARLKEQEERDAKLKAEQEAAQQAQQQQQVITPTTPTPQQQTQTQSNTPTEPITDVESKVQDVRNRFNEAVKKHNTITNPIELANSIKAINDIVNEYDALYQLYPENSQERQAIAKYLMDDSVAVNRLDEVIQQMQTGQIKDIAETKLITFLNKAEPVSKKTTQNVKDVEQEQVIDFAEDINSVFTPVQEQTIREDLLNVTENSANIWIEPLDTETSDVALEREDGVLLLNDDKIDVAKKILTSDIKEGSELDVTVEPQDDFIKKFNAVKDNKQERDELIKTNTPVVIKSEDVKIGYYNTGKYLRKEIVVTDSMIDYVLKLQDTAISTVRSIIDKYNTIKDKEGSGEYDKAIEEIRTTLNEIYGEEIVAYDSIEKQVAHINNILSYGGYNNVPDIISSLNKWKFKIQNDLQATEEVWNEIIRQLDNEANNDINNVKLSVTVSRKTSGSVIHNETLTPVNEVFVGSDVKIAKVDDINNQLNILSDGTTYFNINDGRYKKKNIYLVITKTPNDTFVPLPIYGMNLSEEDAGNIAEQILSMANTVANNAADFNSKIKALALSLHNELSNTIYINGIKSKGKLHFKINTFGNEVINEETGEIAIEYPLVRLSISDNKALSVVRIQDINSSKYRIEIRENKLSEAGKIIEKTVTTKASGFELDYLIEALKQKRYNISYTKYDRNKNTVVDKTNAELADEIRKKIRDKKLGVYASKMVTVDDTGKETTISYFKTTGNRPLILSVKLNKEVAVEAQVGKESVETPTVEQTTIPTVDETSKQEPVIKEKTAEELYGIGWREVKQDEILPMGSEVRMNQETGKSYTNAATDIKTTSLINPAQKTKGNTNPIVVEVYNEYTSLLQQANITPKRLYNEVISAYGNSFTKQDVETIVKKLVC